MWQQKHQHAATPMIALLHCGGTLAATLVGVHDEGYLCIVVPQIEQVWQSSRMQNRYMHRYTLCNFDVIKFPRTKFHCGSCLGLCLRAST